MFSEENRRGEVHQNGKVRSAMCRPLGGADKNAAGTSRCRSVCGRSWRRATSTILQKADVDDLCKILLLTITWLHRFEAALHGASHAKRNGRVDLLFLYPGSYQIPRARCADCLRTSSALLRVRWEGMPVETWLEDRVCLALKVRPDRFKKLLASDEACPPAGSSQVMVLGGGIRDLSQPSERRLGERLLF